MYHQGHNTLLFFLSFSPLLCFVCATILAQQQQHTHIHTVIFLFALVTSSKREPSSPPSSIQHTLDLLFSLRTRQAHVTTLF
ncbi:MAG: hypothetical protein JOS17DRAFT_753761 [Linnemannia elongata]|nr:MAG: hypothetical protein JOS17DRAFT_753761 [Linnemannia elongata]